MGRNAGSTASRNGSRLLVVDDDGPVLKSVARLLKPICELELAKDCGEARAVLERGPVLGVIADLVLPDGDGFVVIEQARSYDPATPSLLITGYLDTKVAARAFAMGIGFLPKPISPENLVSFGRRCLTHKPKAVRLIEALGDDWQARYHLTKTERELLVATASGTPRDELLTSRGIAPTTFKRHVTNLLLKTKEASLDRAALRFLREVLRELD
jgi:DNA-binding NarL/FixJ family response regulator